MNGFFVVEKDGKYYNGGDNFVVDKKNAYAFLLKYLAERLADRIGGKVVWV